MKKSVCGGEVPPRCEKRHPVKCEVLPMDGKTTTACGNGDGAVEGKIAKWDGGDLKGNGVSCRGQFFVLAQNCPATTIETILAYDEWKSQWKGRNNVVRERLLKVRRLNQVVVDIKDRGEWGLAASTAGWALKRPRLTIHALAKYDPITSHVDMSVRRAIGELDSVWRRYVGNWPWCGEGDDETLFSPPHLVLVQEL